MQCKYSLCVWCAHTITLLFCLIISFTLYTRWFLQTSLVWPLKPSLSFRQRQKPVGLHVPARRCVIYLILSAVPWDFALSQCLISNICPLLYRLQPKRVSEACVCCGEPILTWPLMWTPSGGCRAAALWTPAARRHSPGTTSTSHGSVGLLSCISFEHICTLEVNGPSWNTIIDQHYFSIPELVNPVWLSVSVQLRWTVASACFCPCRRRRTADCWCCRTPSPPCCRITRGSTQRPSGTDWRKPKKPYNV